MAEKSLEVTISANVLQLKTAMAEAKAELNVYNSNIRALAKESINASDEMKASINARLLEQIKLASDAEARIASLKNRLAEAGDQAEASGGAFGRLNASFKELGESAEGITNKLTAFTGVFGKIGELVAVGFGADWIGEQVNKVAELGESYGQLQEKTGASISQLAGLRLAAMETGTDFDQVGNGLRSLGSKMQDAVIHPSGEAAEAFKALNIAVTDSSGQLRPVVDVFADISAAMATLQDGAAKTALAGDLLGARYGSSLIPVMNETGQGFGELQDKAQALGLTMSGAGVEASEQFMQAQKDTGAALMGLRDTIFGSNLPAFTALEQEFVIASQDGGLLKDAAIVLDLGLKVLADTSVAVVTAVTEIGDGLNFVGQVMGDVILVADGLAHALDGDFAFARASVKQATEDIANNWTNMLQKMKQQEQLFTNTDNALWSSAPEISPATTMTTLSDHQGTGDQPAPQLTPAAPRGGGGGASRAKQEQDQITQIAQDAAEARKQIATSEYDAQVSNWDAEVSQGKLTKQAEIQDEISATNQMYQANLAEAQQEVALAPVGTAARAKAMDDLEILTASHNAEMAKLNLDLVNQEVADAKAAQAAHEAAAAASAAAWQKAFQPITQAFDSSINGVIQGTETLRSAELKAAQSITLSFIDAAVKTTESWLVSKAQMLASTVATELGMTAATTAGNTARLSAKISADATGKALDVASGSAYVQSSAFKAAAGAYSAVAGIPYVGPVLAPVAGATALAAVLAYDVISAEGGAVIGPGINPLAQLHENEMVLPAYIAQPLASLATGDVFNDQSGGDTSITNTFHNTYHGAGNLDEDSYLAMLNSAVRSGRIQKYPAIARLMRR